MPRNIRELVFDQVAEMEGLGFRAVAPEKATDPALNPEDRVIVEQTYKTVERLLRSLSSRQERAVMMKIVEELPLNEIAQKLGTDRATAQKIYCKAMYKLRHPAALSRLRACC